MRGEPATMRGEPATMRGEPAAMRGEPAAMRGEPAAVRGGPLAIGAYVSPVDIPVELLAAIARHARETFPAECCGYLTGPRNEPRVDEIVRCTNAQASSTAVHAIPTRGAETSFAIDGAELFAFARSLDSDRPARVVYHSHPNGGAYFSALDRDVARRAGYPVHHLVVALTAEGPSEAALFAEVDGDFVEIARWPKSVLG